MTPSFPTRRSSDLANMGRNDIRRGKSDIAPKRVRIAVLAYPGAQRAAIHGLIDLFETASRLAAGAKPRTTFVATEWAVEDCRSEEHTSELQSLMRTSYAVFCWKKKKQH